ncbi:MAG: hypothetical protein KAW02_06240 [candidate division Zixibacteria bacterium]|nr:hypothetical protein [candidate division Zixibacteria bacterium]
MFTKFNRIFSPHSFLGEMDNALSTDANFQLYFVSQFAILSKLVKLILAPNV